MLSGIVKISTFGMVNITDRGFIIKDPITGTFNILKQTKDYIFHNFHTGIWLGKKPFQQNLVGFSTFLLENLNWNALHYVVRIDGQNWSLYYNGQNTQIRKFQQSSDLFEWFYKGQTQRSVRDLVCNINKNKIQYDIALKNSADVAKSLYLYARGLIQESDVYYLILPQDKVELILKRIFGFTPMSKVGLQLKNMIMP